MSNYEDQRPNSFYRDADTPFWAMPLVWLFEWLDRVFPDDDLDEDDDWFY